MRYAYRRSNHSISRHSRPSPLAACLLAALGLGGFAQSAFPATVIVSRCDDPDRLIHGGYSLRQAIGHASEGDTVDASGLVCSSITLALGQISIADDNLTVQGPSSHELTIEAGRGSRVFNHTGTGLVDLSYLTLDFGDSTFSGDSQNGGCIRSSGSVLLRHATLSNCRASSRGGAIYSTGNTTVLTSTLINNYTFPPAGSRGGAIYAKGTVLATYSTIANNGAEKGGGVYSSANVVAVQSIVSGNYGGGVRALGDITLNSCSIEHNQYAAGVYGLAAITLNSTTVADNSGLSRGGGIYSSHQVGNFHPLLRISNSTISGNTAMQGGGIYANSVNVTLNNSTVAFNRSSGYGGGGILARYSNVDANSSIVADNLAGAGVHNFDVNIVGAYLTGSNNLIVSANKFLSGTLTQDPCLTPLASNGGFARTHAMCTSSPALDNGRNIDNLDADERGSGYPRVAGGAPDIGAYERQPNDDEIFYGGFD